MKVSLRRGFEKDKTAGMPLFSNRSGVVGAFILEEDRKWRPDLANVQTVEKCR
ncbi:hypothetical protein C5S39_09790 [Candidatus Methanophagaceae archaeon]|nr:hypothetical protein C5S39_09790 [Methanophagales archaeon]